MTSPLPVRTPWPNTCGYNTTLNHPLPEEAGTESAREERKNLPILLLPCKVVISRRPIHHRRASLAHPASAPSKSNHGHLPNSSTISPLSPNETGTTSMVLMQTVDHNVDHPAPTIVFHSPPIRRFLSLPVVIPMATTTRARLLWTHSRNISHNKLTQRRGW